MKKEFIIGVSLMLISSTLQAQSKRPNIVFILADDLGYGDLSALNEQGKISTPNIDRLSKEGVTFLDAHSSSAVSSPSRYSILTGRYNWRSWKKKGALWWYDKPMISSDRTTMASMLRTQGYQTACIGKWHLGMYYPTTNGKLPVDTQDEYNLDFRKEFTGGPCDVGFDYFFGVDCPNHPPYCFLENRNTVGLPSRFYPICSEMGIRAGRGLEHWNLEKILPTVIEKATDFINKTSKKDNPFFLYLPLTSPHAPIVPTKEFKGKSGMNLYADFVMQTDAAVGKILQALQESGADQHTIVVFTSDNGCAPKADFPFLEKRGHYPSYIFRGMKSDLYEGGHHIPCMVRWPEQIKPHKVKQTICLSDFMATFAALVNYQLADNEAEDSYNILSLFTNDQEPAPIREATVHHSIDGSFAIRQGKWKLMLINYSGGWSAPSQKNGYKEPFQLYDLEKDPKETTNLYASCPEKVEELRQLLVQYIKDGRSTKGLPQNNEDVDKKNPCESQDSWYQLSDNWFK